MTTLWDTTGTAVVKALAAERRTAGAVTSGNALTLVVVVEHQDVDEAEEAASVAASRHPMRMFVVVRRHIDAPVPRLDAEVTIGGRLGPGESVVLRMYGRLALHAESVTLPLLAPDAPVVTWWHSDAPERIAYDPLGVFAERRITDVRRMPDPSAGAAAAGRGLRTRRHRPRLDPPDTVACGAGVRVRRCRRPARRRPASTAGRTSRRPGCWPGGCQLGSGSTSR